MTTPLALPAVIEAATAYLSVTDPVMARVIALVGPCTLTSSPDIFEALVDAIVSQQISVKAADAIMARVRAAVPGNQITPDTIATLTPEELRALGLSTPKARYVRNLIEHIANGQLDLVHLPELDDETIISQLVAVKGIGRWTAEMILIFSLSRPDVLPADDLGFLEGVREAYALTERPTPKEMRVRGEPWRPYRTFATWYMWAFRRISQRNERVRTRIVSL